ncbi:MAG: hypothetical protein FWG25_04745, partial [Promicromonosporaceae bacterium]|nr:hypothetical protein [Promicromonosporaceae bacterium]
AATASGVDVLYVSRAHVLREGDWADADLAAAEWLDDQVGLEWLTDDDDIPTRPNIFVPFVAHIRDGAVVDFHRGTFEGHSHIGEGDARHLPELTANQHAALLLRYRTIFSGVGDGCSAQTMTCS